MAVGSTIKRRRDMKGLSLRQVSKRSGVTKQGLSYIERGMVTPTPQTLRKVSLALNLNYQDLLIEAGHLRATDAVTTPEQARLLERGTLLARLGVEEPGGA